MKTREEAMEQLIKGSFNLQLNMSDTFMWGCSDVEEINADDAMNLIKYIQKYDYFAIDSFVSVKRELLGDGVMHPMLMQDSYKKYFGDTVMEERENYTKAREEIKSSITSGEDFSSLAYGYQKIKEDEIEFGEEVKLKGVQLAGQTYFTQIAYLSKLGISGTGVNMKEARENLRRAFDRSRQEKK